MAYQTLNITFAGACVHLHDLIPGIPMRTVLPWALQVHFGTVWFPEAGSMELKSASYYMLPHVSWIRTRFTGGIGLPLQGQYLSIANAVGPYQCDRGNGFSLPQYVKDFELDEHVVFGGNAACYFDTFYGNVWTEGKENEARTTHVQMQTDGPPILRLTPLPGAAPDVRGAEIRIDTNELFISNLDFDPACEYRNFDFLMNYLVAKGGIPKVLDERVPGMTPESKSVTFLRLGLRLKALGEAVTTLGSVAGYLSNGGKIDRPEQPNPVQSSSGAVSLDSGDLPWPMIDPVPFDTSCSPSNVP